MEYIISLIILLMGYFFQKYLDRNARLEERRIQFLLDTYLSIERFIGSHDRKDRKDVEYEFEKSLARIQLLGTVKQIEESEKVVDGFSSDGRAGVESLLADLRNSLRKDLKLKKYDKPLRTLRFK